MSQPTTGHDRYNDAAMRTAEALTEASSTPFRSARPGDNPYILEIRHGRKNPGRENGWHTVVTWMERPSLGSIAQLIEGPPVGGDTLFSDSHACYSSSTRGRSTSAGSGGRPARSPSGTIVPSCTTP